MEVVEEINNELENGEETIEVYEQTQINKNENENENQKDEEISRNENKNEKNDNYPQYIIQHTEQMSEIALKIDEKQNIEEISDEDKTKEYNNQIVQVNSFNILDIKPIGDEKKELKIIKIFNKKNKTINDNNNNNNKNKNNNSSKIIQKYKTNINKNEYLSQKPQILTASVSTPNISKIEFKKSNNQLKQENNNINENSEVEIKNTNKSNYQFRSSFYSKKNQQQPLSPPLSKRENHNHNNININRIIKPTISKSIYNSKQNQIPSPSSLNLSYPRTSNSNTMNSNSSNINININKNNNHYDNSLHNDNCFIKQEKRIIQTPKGDTNTIIINNLIYYIRCPNCNYLLNDVTNLPKKYSMKNINSSNICNISNISNSEKDNITERDKRQIEYRREMEEKKRKEKKEREERELKERNERNERLKKQKEENEKKEKLKKEKREKREKYIKNEEGILKRGDFEIYRQNKKEIIIKNKNNENKPRNYYKSDNEYTVFKPAVKYTNLRKNENKPDYLKYHNESKNYGYGNNVGIYESHGT